MVLQYRLERVVAEKLIGSLIYGTHKTPKKARPWKERLKVELSIVCVLVFLGGLAYRFVNYREENRVKQFFEQVRQGQYETAYAGWDTGSGRYSLQDFLVDWGNDGYYTKGMHTARIKDSNS